MREKLDLKISALHKEACACAMLAIDGRYECCVVLVCRFALFPATHPLSIGCVNTFTSCLGCITIMCLAGYVCKTNGADGLLNQKATV